MLPAPSKKYLYLLFLTLFPFYLTWTFDHSLWNPDETRDAGIAREMFVDKDFVVPHLNGEAFLEKPPLYYWTCAVVYTVAGRITDGLTRLPAALYGFLGVLFTFLIGGRCFNPRAGFIAAAIMGTAAQYFRMSHMALMDSSLAALLAGAFYFYLSENIFLFVIFTILAFYTKGFVGVALAGVVIGTDLLLQKNFKKLAVITAIGAVIFALAVAPWIYGLWKGGGSDYLRVFFVDNNWNRFFNSKGDHAQPFYFYVGSFLADFLPWTFAFVGALAMFWKKPSDRKLQFIKIWFFSIFIFLSLSSSKRSMYLLPLFPAAALLCGAWWDRLITRVQANRLEKTLLALTIALVSVVLVVLFIGYSYLHKSIVILIIGLMIGALLSVPLLPHFKRKDYWHVFQGLFFGTCVALVSADILFIGDMDRDKSFLPFINEIKHMRAESKAELVAFDLSEMERGVFPFYLEEKIPNFKKFDDLISFLNKNKERRILLVASRNRFNDLDPHVKDSMSLVATFRPDKKTRSYLLYANKTVTRPK